MISQPVELWLKSTIPGIVVLGAIGSIVAFFILKIIGVVTRKAVQAMVPRLIVMNVRPFTTAALHCRRFVNSGRFAQLIIYATGLVVALNAWLVIAAVCLVGTAVVAVQSGTSQRGLLITLVSATGLSLIMLLRQLLYLAGAASLLFYKDMREVSKLFKNPDMVMAITEILAKELQEQKKAADAFVAAAPTTPPAASHPEAAAPTIAQPATPPTPTDPSGAPPNSA